MRESPKWFPLGLLLAFAGERYQADSYLPGYLKK